MKQWPVNSEIFDEVNKVITVLFTMGTAAAQPGMIQATRCFNVSAKVDAAEKSKWIFSASRHPDIMQALAVAQKHKALEVEGIFICEDYAPPSSQAKELETWLKKMPLLANKIKLISNGFSLD